MVSSKVTKERKALECQWLWSAPRKLVQVT